MTISSCGGGGGGSGGKEKVSQVTVKANFQVNASGTIKVKATSITKIKYLVSGPGLETMNGTVSVSGNIVEIPLTVKNGPQRYFLIEALDKNNIMKYSGDAYKDLTGDPAVVEITLTAVSPLVGTWGYGRLQHGNDGMWSVKAGKIIFNKDGTGIDTYHYNDNGTLGATTEIFTYVLLTNQDGSISVNYTYADGTNKIRRYILSDNGNMMITDGIDELPRQRMRIFVRMDPSKTYTNADVFGEYYTIGYEHASLGPNWPSYYAWSGIATFNDNGEFQTNITINADGIIIPDKGTYTYSVNPDGSTTDSADYSGYLAGDGKVNVLTRVTKTQQRCINISMKKGDRLYSTSDLAGTWVIAGFGDFNLGESIFATIGTWTCDNGGNCNISLKRQIGGNIVYETAYRSFTVSFDGSFGASIGPVIPFYASAIGNDGNTMLFNRSFITNEVLNRRILVGVRCSNCSNIIDVTGIQGKWLFFKSRYGEKEQGPFCQTINQTGGSFTVSGELNGSGSIDNHSVQLNLNFIACDNPATVTSNGTTDGFTMVGTYSADGGCGNENGTWRAIRGVCPQQ